MAYEVIKEVPNVHEDAVCSIAFDRAKRAVYTAAEGDKGIKVGHMGLVMRQGSAGGRGRCAPQPSPHYAVPRNGSVARRPPPN